MQTDTPSQKTATGKRDRLSCKPQAVAPGKGISLPIIAVDPKTGIKLSRAGRWRAYSLAGVHVFMLAHVVHWLWAGSTYTPIEPSESMETIRTSQINMGFIFFAAAILATMILGRWVCGWGCHLIAYQDLSLWVFKKLHMRPKAFRSRFLILVPLVAALWMFIFPLALRLYDAWLGHPQPKLGWHLTRTGFWDTFPGPVIAIATVLVCGVAMIYFLGPKGFCTYACPYGAFFGMADKLAVARIRVTDDCHQCGHCTAVCTSNVDVAREVNLYKMVIDPGCMKCLDCVEVCPNDALYVGFGRPAIAAKPIVFSDTEGIKKPSATSTRRFDMTLSEEFVAVVVFAASLFCVYGSYTTLPFLMSLGVAGVMTYLVMMGVRLIYQPDVMIQKRKLKSGSRLTPLGMGYAALVLAITGFSIHSGIWHYHDVMGNLAFQQSPPEVANWQYDSSFLSRISDRQKAAVADGIRHLEICERIGLIQNGDNRLKLAWMYLFSKEPQLAPMQIMNAINSQPNEPHLWTKLARAQTVLGDINAAKLSYDNARSIETTRREKLARKAPNITHPASADIWAEWGTFLMHSGERGPAEEALKSAVKFDPASATAQLALADLQIVDGRIDEARKALLGVLRNEPRNVDVVARLKAITRAPQNFDQAVADYREYLAHGPPLAAVHYNLAHGLTETNRFTEAVEEYRKALAIEPNVLTIRADLGAALVSVSDLPGAIREYEIITSKEPKNAEAALRLGFLYAQTGRVTDAKSQLEIAVQYGDEQQRQNAKSILEQLH